MVKPSLGSWKYNSYYSPLKRCKSKGCLIGAFKAVGSFRTNRPKIKEFCRKLLNETGLERCTSKKSGSCSRYVISSTNVAGVGQCSILESSKQKPNQISEKLIVFNWNKNFERLRFKNGRELAN